MMSEHCSFWNDQFGQIRMDYIQHRMKAQPGSNPCIPWPNRAGPIARAMIQKNVDAMLQKEIIYPAKSEWITPAVLVPNLNGSWRICIDYRRFNAIKFWDAYSVLRIDDCVDSLGAITWFSKLDASSGYWQVPVAKRKDIEAWLQGDGQGQAMKPVQYGVCTRDGHSGLLSGSTISEPARLEYRQRLEWNYRPSVERTAHTGTCSSVQNLGE